MYRIFGCIKRTKFLLNCELFARYFGSKLKHFRLEIGQKWVKTWQFTTAIIGFNFKLCHSIEIIFVPHFNISSDFQQTKANYIRNVNAINWIEKIISFKAFVFHCFIPTPITSKMTKKIRREREAEKKKDCRSQREEMSFCSSSQRFWWICFWIRLRWKV